ncbi:MAG TPA: UDP-N-acetylmuramate--L-alanine ligase [Candidatus Paceibacterota bacterium]|nr:UDP-N-acetylmuramate--L-alanine ligase [Candidatus Paceibacterota bacterium]HMP18913.1 UDP-N-acetylmuramate--L-alanine ligase [Candidatus Paceibacterota bacterium]HMP85074.1 UDP-N-acetylmuramate--L-alanine ligase [Candidatus Paceibacterota bacterium]
MKNIFFVGIGGKGLNGIAKICLEKGFNVFGVDKDIKPETVALSEMGAVIFYEHKESNINKNIDLVVYSAIIKEDCPEIVKAKKLGIKIIKRAEFLGQLTKNDFRISVCGSHGKSTTTALVGLSMINSNIDATIFGGAPTRELDGYNHLGKSKYTVIESCEYDRSFFHLVGNITIITSIEKSHLEYYKDESEMLDSFAHYINLHNENSLIIANGDDSNIRKLTAHSRCRVVYFGFDQRNDYVISDVLKTLNGSNFSIYKNGHKIINNLNIKIPGLYNILNFTATAVLLERLGLKMDGVIETARHFSGVGRRFEISYLKSGQIFIDDFAHHPTQVKNLFDGIRQFFPNEKTCAIFQPRQYNLMKNFLTEYGQAFKKADEIILTDILPNLGDTQEDIKSVNSFDIAQSISKHSQKPVKIINSFPEIIQYLKSKYYGRSVITTIGTGNIYEIKNQFIKSIN